MPGVFHDANEVREGRTLSLQMDVDTYPTNRLFCILWLYLTNNCCIFFVCL